MGRDATEPSIEPEAEKIDHLDGGTFVWAIVEIFGHRRHSGRACEEERFGAKMLRIDIPQIEWDGDEAKVTGWTTHFYGGSSIFSYSLTDEETVLRANRPYRAAGTVTLPSPCDYEEEDEYNA